MSVYIVRNTSEHTGSYDFRHEFELQAQSVKVGVVPILPVECNASVDAIE